MDYRGDVYVAPREHDDGETMWIMEGLDLYGGLSITEKSPSQRAMDAQGSPKNATVIKGGRSTNGIICRVGETIAAHAIAGRDHIRQAESNMDVPVHRRGH